MIIKDLLEILDRFAEDYRKDAIDSIKRNNHINEVTKQLNQKDIDAVLVGFINYIAMNHGVDYALRTKDFNQLNK